MPPWPSRILSPNSDSHRHVESPITSSPLSGGELDSSIAAQLYDVPVLRSTNSHYSLNPSQRNRSSHGRSVSHPFPSLLGGSSAKRGTEDPGNTSSSGSRTRGENGRSSANEAQDAAGLGKSPTKNGKAVSKEGDLRTGNCITCDSMVRWPKQLDVYRCTNCLMINDLKPSSQNVSSPPPSDGKRLDVRPARKALPLTVERTRDLAEQCVKTYLKEKVDETKGFSQILRAQSPNKHVIGHEARDPTGLPQDHDYLSPTSSLNHSMDARSFPPTRLMTMPTRPDASNRTGRSTTPPKERPVWKQVFTPLEEYLVSCLKDCDSMNASFALTRPTPIRGSSEVSNTSEKHCKREETFLNEEGFFELDAKTLLLGDIGENGQWWTGERPSKPNKLRKDEEHEKKPSRFDWAAIYAWYDSILSCGRDWRLLISTLPADSAPLLMAQQEEIDVVLKQGRYHVQRTFLKAVETLLRRPCRPLQTAEDVRFLVILLTNPLLYPSSSESASRRTTSDFPAEDFTTIRKADGTTVRSQGIANGHHSGIIKRILGLMANLPLPCHQALISWFCRVSELQFRDFVELVGGFVSYRLTRQKSRSKSQVIDFTAGLIPDLSGPGGGTSAHLHAAIGETAKASKEKKPEKEQAYRDDWQVKTAAKVMSLLFAANMFPRSSRYEHRKNSAQTLSTAIRQRARKHSQLLPTNYFYNTRLDYVDLVGDFEAWEARRGKFSFCQYPMFLSIWAKIHILEHDARRQMEIKARDAFFTTIMKGKAVSQFLVFKVRRDCLVDDSLKNISQITGGGEEEIKKSLKIEFQGEEGVDAGGLRKEWFLLLTREVFDPEHGLFIYDQDSNYCYFNPFSFETSDQFFLIGVLLGLAIYNSTILDISLPPFAFRKLLASAPNYTGPSTTAIRPPPSAYSLADLAEWKPSLARGLQQLLDHEGSDVEEIFCRDFVVEVERYGSVVQVPLCPGGERKPVTNANRKEFVDLYLRYLLDTSVARQYEPFKRGFFSVCGGNALSLFRPEEIELLIRGSDEPLDTASIRGVASYENCSPREDYVRWFWEIFESAEVKYQREILAFITGSDRIPAMGATSLVIKVVCLGADTTRFPIARTCFNVLGLWPYSSKEILADRLWRAVQESEGFGLK